MIIKTVWKIKKHNVLKSIYEILYLVAIFSFIFYLLLGNLLNIYNHSSFIKRAGFTYHYILPANIKDKYKGSFYEKEAYDLQQRIDSAAQASNYFLSFKSEYIYANYSEEKTFDIKKPYYKNQMLTTIDFCRISDLSHLQDTVYTRANFESGYDMLSDISFTDNNYNGYIILDFDAKRLLDVNINSVIEKTIGDITLKLKVIGFLKPSLTMDNNADINKPKNIAINKYAKASLVIADDMLFEELRKDINTYYSIYTKEKLPVDLEAYTISKKEYDSSFERHLKGSVYSEEGQRSAIAMLLLLIISGMEINYAKKRNYPLLNTLSILGMKKRNLKELTILLSLFNLICALFISLPITLLFFFRTLYMSITPVLITGIILVIALYIITYINSIFIKLN